MRRDPKTKTLKRLLSPYLVISSKTRVCSAWSELAEFRANTSKLQRSTSWEGDQSRRRYEFPPVWCPTFLAKHAVRDGRPRESYPQAVYNRCRLVWHGCRVGPLEHPGIMQCLCWVQLEFRWWHCAANSSHGLFTESPRSPPVAFGRMF